MKIIFAACLLVNSAAAFARPFPFGGRRGSSSSTAAASPVPDSPQNSQTCLQATPSSAIESKPAVIDAANWELLSERGQAAVARLIAADEGFGAQAHVYSDWPAAGTDDEGKKRLAEQVSGALVCGVECAGED